MRGANEVYTLSTGPQKLVREVSGRTYPTEQVTGEPFGSEHANMLIAARVALSGSESGSQMLVFLLKIHWRIR